MKKLSVFRIGIITVSFLLSSCGLSPSGMIGGIWIDQPLDGAMLPIAPVTIQAHASDSNGIAKIEFFVADTLVNSVSVGGERMEGASIEWEPAGAGSYTIQARAIDNQGNTLGDTATIQIMVSNIPSSTNTPTPMINESPVLTSTSFPPSETFPSPTNAINSSSTPTIGVSTPTFTLTQNANCRSGPSTNYPVIGFLVQGQTASIEGRNAENNWFWVLRPANNEHCWVSMSTGVLNGYLQGIPIVAAPPLDTATVTSMPGITAPPMTVIPTFAIIETLKPVDNTPPAITNVSLTPSNISKQGCGKPDTLTVSATVTDVGSGVANVTYEIHGPVSMDFGNGILQPVGGNLYQATIGPITGSADVWTLWLHSRDQANNTSDAGPWTFNVFCIQ